MPESTCSRVVLFGAGASFGSPAILPIAPPLGADLYPVLARAFPESWGALGDDLRSAFSEHFESGMAALWSIYPSALSQLVPGAPSPHRLMQELARFFLSFRLAPGGRDLYTTLLVALWKASKGQDTCFATLNYEHLAEQAMTRVGLPPKLLRPHGGCQLWLARGGKTFGSGRAVGQGMNSISARIKPLPQGAIETRLNIERQIKYPCMAMYLDGKVTQMGQRYLWRAQHRFAARVMSATAVALIGVRPWPSDTHIWEPIIETTATVYYVGGEADFEVLRKLRGEGESAFIGSRFEECVEILANEL